VDDLGEGVLHQEEYEVDKIVTRKGGGFEL